MLIVMTRPYTYNVYCNLLRSSSTVSLNFGYKPFIVRWSTIFMGFFFSLKFYTKRGYLLKLFWYFWLSFVFFTRFCCMKIALYLCFFLDFLYKIKFISMLNFFLIVLFFAAYSKSIFYLFYFILFCEVTFLINLCFYVFSDFFFSFYNCLIFWLYGLWIL
jgi:hypothetical protein